MSQVPYLGHVFSGKGMSPDKQKLSAVEEWPTPQNAADVRKFLGLASYYRRYILNFSDIAKPYINSHKKIPNLYGLMNIVMPSTPSKTSWYKPQYWHSRSLKKIHPLLYSKQMQAQWAWVLYLNRMVTW